MTVDPLPSWREGTCKSAILDWVKQADAMAPDERVAVFDNDGTLWTEQPMVTQGVFALDRLRQLAEQDPSWRRRQPFKAYLEHDLATIATLGKQGILEFMYATHAGMTPEAFDAVARAWLATATHPRFKRRYTACVYQPQLELLAYLRAHQFATYIVSGGGVEFLRAFAGDTYDVPPEHVIGSSAKMSVQVADGHAELHKEAQLQSFDDRDEKVVNIDLHIGRRPLLAVGNSDGDLRMLQYAKWALLVHHDDAEREYAYDADYRISPLVDALPEARSHHWPVVSMRQDWATVFPAPLPM